MKTVILLVARMSSSRLPGKVLMPIAGVPMIGRQIERVRRSKLADEVVLATSEDPSDDPLASYAESVGVRAYRGHRLDVLGRVRAAAEFARADTIVHLLGDQPLMHSDLVDEVLRFYRAGGYDYATDLSPTIDPGSPNGFPVGLWTQAYRRLVIERAASETSDPYHREHSTSYIHSRRDLFKVGVVEASGPWEFARRPDLNLAVNYLENYELVKAVFERCLPKNPDFGLADAIAAVDADPALKRLMGNH